jgi:phosphatidate phosphatase LPIN
MTTYVERLFSAVSNALEFNTATLSGAADIIVVEGEDGIRRSIPWNVRFGKLRLLKSREKIVNVFVNDEPCEIFLTLDTAGEAYFVAETDQPPPPDLAPSPASEPSSPKHQPVSSSVSPELLSRKLQESTRTDSCKESDIYPGEGKQLASYLSDSEFDVNLRSAKGLQEENSTLKSCKRGSQDDLTLGLKNKKLSAKLTGLYGSPSRQSLDNSLFSNVNGKHEALVGDERYSSTFPGQKSESISIASSNISPPSLAASSPTSWMDTFLKRFTSRKELHPVGKTNGSHSGVQDDNFNLRSSEIPDKAYYSDSYHYLASDDSDDSADTVKSTLDRKQSNQSDDLSTKMSSVHGYNKDPKEFIANHVPEKKEPSTSDTLSTCSSSETEADDLFVSQLSSRKSKELGEFVGRKSHTWHLDNSYSKVSEEVPQYLAYSQNRSSSPKKRDVCENDDGIVSNSAVSGHNRENSKFEQGQGEDLSKAHNFLEISSSKDSHFSDADYPIALSLCGHLIRQEMPEDVKMNIFEHNRVGYSQFSSDPSILSHPNLLMRVGGKLMTWKEAGPLIVSILAFAVPLDATNGSSTHKKKVSGREEHGRKRFSWFGFRSQEGNVSGEPLITDDMIAMAEKESSHSNVSSEGGRNMESLTLNNSTETQGKRFLIKTRRPSKEELEKLPLRPGMNVVKFVVNSSLQGVQELASRIFLWSHDTKIVVSDVDGTITRSDVLGHLLPRVGKDWSHEGIAKLYSLIAKNGYKMLYLTSRAIGQATSTRTYIQSLCQDSKYGLPEGPVVMSPDRLVESLTREVIRKRPQEFKIAALRNVKELFADGYNAFYAGFGNRYTDLISYTAVGIRPNRIFLINWKGELQICNYVFETVGSYRSLQQFVDEIFVDISSVHGTQAKEEVLHEDDYNDWNFWKPVTEP